MSALDIFLLAAAGLVLLWTAIPLLHFSAWWVRSFDFPRVQIALLTAIVLLVNLWLRGLGSVSAVLVAVLLSACIAYQVARIIRYSPFVPVDVLSTDNCEENNRIGLLVANVLTPNRNSAGLLAMIREKSPDIVLTVETDRWWGSELAALEGDYPHTIKRPLDNLYGMHLYSRLPMSESEVLYLVEDDVPSMHTKVTLRSGKQVSLHCLHPRPPSPTENPTSEERDAELLVLARSITGKPRATIVTGDLNDVAWSATTTTFRHLSGLLDPRIGRGMYSTFHARYAFLRWPLDHLFCSADFSLLHLERLGYFGSDHFPIFLELCHNADVARKHDEPSADAEERQIAEEKIAAADADRAALN